MFQMYKNGLDATMTDVPGFANDSHRMYVRHSHWEAMKEGYMLTNDIADVTGE